MDSISIPRRYLSPDPAETWGTISHDKLRDKSFHLYLALMGLRVEDGKAVRTQRVQNSFMQVYSVQLLDCSEEDLNEVYGTIVVGREYKIFDRRLDDKDSRLGIDPKGFARLTGPIIPIDVEECTILIYPRLFRKNQPGDLFHPKRGVKFNEWGPVVTKDMTIPVLDEIGIDGEYMSDHRAMIKRSERLLEEDFETVCGRVKVFYAMFDDAADSFLTVKLLRWNGEGHSADVYGRIHTSNTLITDPRAKSVAFDRERDNHLSVNPRQYIPMHRPVTVVPMGHYLKVEVEIFHKKTGSGEHDKDVLIADDTWFVQAKSLNGEFSDQYTDVYQSAIGVQFTGICDSRIISGEWGEIELKVYWMPCWNRRFLGELDYALSMDTVQ